jgi:hypothetical protein
MLKRSKIMMRKSQDKTIREPLTLALSASTRIKTQNVDRGGHGKWKANKNLTSTEPFRVNECLNLTLDKNMLNISMVSILSVLSITPTSMV